jgi:hypothetical protein
VAQIGTGEGSHFPQAIDTRQTFVNSPMAAPDSASRMDAEVVNDTLHALVQVETTLGANPQGTFASVAARLQQFFPGGGTSPLGFTFASTTSVTIPGSSHNLGTASPLIQIYDNASPRFSLEPNTISIDTSTYDVTTTFQTPQSGVVCLANPQPQYSTTFTNQLVVTVPGTVHGLNTALLFVTVYSLNGGQHVLSGGSVTVNTGTYDVVITFQTPQSGALTLSAAGPRYSTNFTNQTTLTVLGGTHGLETAALLYQVYDASTPARALMQPNTFSVDQGTFTVTVTFGQPQSGTLLLVGASTISGNEFQLRDSGVTNVSAVRVYSELGTLKLQMGTGEEIVAQNATGEVVQTTDEAGNFAITGTATKPGGGSWESPSDVRLKRDVRPFTAGLEEVLRLEPVWFRYNGKGGVRADDREHVSLIAQAAQAIAPYLVGTQWGVLERGAAATELLTLDTTPLLYLLLNAIKTLSQAHQAQEARLARLEALLLPPEEVSA